MGDVGFLGFVDDAGHFALDERDRFMDYLHKFKGQEVVLTVKRRPRRGSLQQLRYFRGVVIPDIAKATGVSDPADYEDVYEGVMHKFAGLPPGPFGAPRRRSLSLSSEHGMSLEERKQLIDDVIMWAETEIPDCRIRRPEDVDLDRIHDPGWK
jgi:hypothetical protein